MSFLRSLIADSRPRQPLPDPLAVGAENPRGSGQAHFGVEAKHPHDRDRTPRRSRPLPAMAGNGEDIMRDIPAYGTDEAGMPGAEDAPRTSWEVNPLTVPVEETRPVPANDGPNPLDSGNSAVREPDSQGGRADETKREMTRQPTAPPIPDRKMDAPPGHSHDFSGTLVKPSGDAEPASGHAATEVLISAAGSGTPSNESSITSDGHRAHQARAGAGPFEPDNTTVMPAGEEPPAHEKPAETTIADPRPQPESTMQTPQSPAIGAEDKGTAVANTSEDRRPIEADSVEPDNAAGRDEARNAPAHGTRNAQIIPNGDRQKDMQRPFIQAPSAQVRKRDAVRGVFGQDLLGSPQVKAMAAHPSQDLKPASIPQPAVDPKPAEPFSPAPVPPPQGSPVPPMARPARFSPAGPQTLRSVPARPFQADSMPKAGRVLHAKPPLGALEKKPAAPKVQIGQIDVIIQAPAPSSAKPAAAPASTDMASRLYLRRL